MGRRAGSGPKIKKKEIAGPKMTFAINQNEL